jgi:hypothetical protein
MFEIIDGHHRIESMKRFLVNNPKGSINGELYVFNPLTTKEAIDIYLHLDATTRKQSTSDVLRVSSPLARIYDYINKDFPIKTSFYGSEDSLMYSRIFKTYFDRENETTTDVNKDKLVSMVISSDMQDYYNLKEFYDMMVEIFGVYHIQNPYYKQANLYFLQKVWFQNKFIIGENKIKKLLKNNLKGNYLFSEDFSITRGRVEIDSKSIKLLNILNKGNRGNKIIIAKRKEYEEAMK